VVATAVLAAQLVWAASSKVGVPKREALWTADQFMSAGLWMGLAALATLVASVALLRSGADSRITHLVDVVALAGASVAAGYTLSCAVAAERMNYWDAIHFSTLVWLGFLAAVGATVVASLATRRGDEPARALGWLPGLLTALWILAWMLTWFSPLTDFVAWVAGSWYLATHG